MVVVVSAGVAEASVVLAAAVPAVAVREAVGRQQN
jgi:hypothetical protein